MAINNTMVIKQELEQYRQRICRIQESNEQDELQAQHQNETLKREMQKIDIKI